jgi:hypothetical protein
MMQQSRWERLAPLTGLIAVAIIIAVFAIGGSTPDEDDSASKVVNFYSKHHDKHMTLGFILAISVPFLIAFASTLRYELRRAGGSGQLATMAFGGGVLAAAGFGILSTVHIALSSAAEQVATYGTAQTLNVLDANDFIPAAAGVGVLVLAAGMSVVRHGGLPRWLGWVAVVFGIATFTPGGFIAVLASGIWIIVVSILLTLARHSAPAAPAVAGGDPVVA